MKIKNSLIQALVENGISNTTNHEVPVKDAYKAFKFRDAVVKAAKELAEKRDGIVKEAGIEDAAKFDERRKELAAITNPNDEQKKEISEMNDKFDKFRCLFNELMNDETDLPGIKLMSFDSFHALAKENRNTRIQIMGSDKNPSSVTVDFYEIFMGELEGILWEAPTEE